MSSCPLPDFKAFSHQGNLSLQERKSPSPLQDDTTLKEIIEYPHRQITSLLTILKYVTKAARMDEARGTLSSCQMMPNSFQVKGLQAENKSASGRARCAALHLQDTSVSRHLPKRHPQPQRGALFLLQKVVVLH